MHQARKMAVLGSLVAGLMLVVDAGAQQQPPPVKDDALTQEARELFSKGSKAASAGQWEQCRAAYLASWNINRHWQTAGNLALCEAKLKRNTEAARHLAFFLRESPPDKRKDGQTLFDEVRAKVAQIDVKVDVSDAEVLVDGLSHGRTPLKDPVFVEPGKRVFEAKAIGYEIARSEVETTAGSQKEITIAMVKLPASDIGMPPPTPTATATSTAPMPPPDQPKKSIIPPIALGAVGVVGLGVGIGLFAAGSSKRSDAEAKKAEIGDNGGNCNSPGPAFQSQCDELDDLNSSTDTLKTAGVVGMLIGGTSLVAAGAYLLFWPAPQGPRQAGAVSITSTPVVGAGHAGMLVKGTF